MKFRTKAQWVRTHVYQLRTNPGIVWFQWRVFLLSIDYRRGVLEREERARKGRK